MSTHSNIPSFFHELDNGTVPPYECYRQIKVTSRGIWTGDNPLDFPVPVLMLQITLSFLATWTIKFLLRPLKQPKIVSAIIGGIILGPSVLGRNKMFKQNVFPRNANSVVEIISSLGVVYVIFLMGVKMDTTMVLNSGRKAVIIGLSCLFIPFIINSITAYILKDFLTELGHGQRFLIFLTSSLSITAFPNLSFALDELKLLNSELGRLAMSCAMFNDMIGWLVMALFASSHQSNLVNSVKVIMFYVLLVCFLVFFVRPLISWVVKRIPKGRQVDEVYVVIILLGVLVMGLITDKMGASIADGPLFFGLILPEGPPLGAALVEKSEVMVMEFLLPFLFILSGLSTNVFAIFQHWKNVLALMFIIFMGYIGKLVGTLLPSLYCKMSFRSSLSLGLIMNIKGIIELLTFLHWQSMKLLDEQSQAILIISTLLVTAIVTPLTATLYNPQKQFTTRFAAGKIENTRSNSDFRILTCIHDDINVHTIITLLEASHATESSHICVYVLHLVELVGEAASRLISHDKHWGTSKTTGSDHIMNAFNNYKQNTNGYVWVHPFTAIAPYNTMYQDICSLAQDKRVSLIILPFPQNGRGGALCKLNTNVLAAAGTPCSVGILVDHGLRNIIDPKNFSHKVAVIFLGGGDDREALAYGTRMSMHPNVTVTVVRFCLRDNKKDNKMERQLDDTLVDKFKLKNISNASAIYHEVMVEDGPEAMGVLRSLDNIYDLVMVGQRRGTNPQFLELERMKDWSEIPELGVVGDMLASSDFGGGVVSVLVLHQTTGDADGTTV